jgi:hypothetical protein
MEVQESNLTPAIDELERAAERCEHNAPIWEVEGDPAQAQLCRLNAAAYRAAVEKLKA